MNPIVHNQPLTRSQADIIEHKLIRMLRTGLAEAGIPTGNRRFGLLCIDSLSWSVGVQVSAYTWRAPIWRITFGGREPRPWSCLIYPHELTLHLSEFSSQTGVDLARLLRDPDWRWPLFNHDRAYPTYAWSKLAKQTYEAHRLELEGIASRAAERRASR